jgi:hypothetical protein
LMHSAASAVDGALRCVPKGQSHCVLNDLIVKGKLEEPSKELEGKVRRTIQKDAKILLGKRVGQEKKEAV